MCQARQLPMAPATSCHIFDTPLLDIEVKSGAYWSKLFAKIENASSTHAIIIIQPTMLACYLPQIITHDHIYCTMATTQVMLPPTWYPITCKLQCNRFHININPPIPTIANQPIPVEPSSLLRKIKATLPQYAPKLWNNANPHQTHQLQPLHVNNAQGPTWLISNAKKLRF